MDRIHDLLTDDFVDHGPPVSPTPGPDGHITILTFVTTVLQIRYEVHDGPFNFKRAVVISLS